MKNMISHSSIGLACALFLMGAATQAAAETFTVKMVSYDKTISDKSMYFDPPLLHVQLGDTVIFEPTQTGHNTASKKGMLPDGAEKWNSAIDEQFEVTFNTNGTYGYICSPHYAVGMIGMILVGDYSTNLEEVRKVRHRGKAKKAFKNLFNQVDALK